MRENSGGVASESSEKVVDGVTQVSERFDLSDFQKNLTPLGHLR